ncbi:MAG: OB-fold domain-containing protein [Deltaproteobacteria bacterium]|nr:OB-fold domain-containing protein [Deltaproteobacteria bacterium]
MAVEGSVGERKQRPIADMLRLPTAPGEKPYLVGYRCQACGATYIGEGRVGCSKCTATDPLTEIRLSDRGSLYVYSIVHQSVPGVPVPYVSAIVDLPEGVSVRCNLVDIEPDPAKIQFGMPVEMVTRKVRERKEKNAEGVEETIDIIAFFFKPSQN